MSVGTALPTIVTELHGGALYSWPFTAFLAAWVVPGLVGPALAGFVTQHFGWRWVFLGLAPFVAVGVLLVLGVVRRLPPHEATPADRPGLPLAALGAAFGLSALTWAAQHPGL